MIEEGGERERPGTRCSSKRARYPGYAPGQGPSHFLRRKVSSKKPRNTLGTHSHSTLGGRTPPGMHDDRPRVALSHTLFTLPHHHRHPICLALTSSLQIYSNYLRRGHHFPTSALLAGILTASQKIPSLALASSSSNCGKPRPQECSALGKHQIWKTAKIPPLRLPRKPNVRFAGRSGKGEGRNCSKLQKTFVLLSSPSPLLLN